MGKKMVWEQTKRGKPPKIVCLVESKLVLKNNKDVMFRSQLAEKVFNQIPRIGFSESFYTIVYGPTLKIVLPNKWLGLRSD